MIEQKELLEITDEDIKRSMQEALDLIKKYSAVVKDETTNKNDVKEAANAAIKALVKHIDLLGDSRVELILAGQLLGEYITGNKSKPKRS